MIERGKFVGAASVVYRGEMSAVCVSAVCVSAVFV